MANLPDISDRIRSLVGDIQVTVSPEGDVSGSNTAYLDNVSGAFKHYNVYGEVSNALPAIIDGNGTTAEKVDSIGELLYNNSHKAVSAVRKYDQEFMTATGLALAEAAQLHHQSHPNVNEYKLNLPAGVEKGDKTNYVASYTHSYEQSITDFKTGDVYKEQRHGRIKVNHNVAGGRELAQQHKAMLHLVAENANKGLAD